MASSSFNVDFTSSSTSLEKVDYASLAKTLNSNQPLKLDKSNYIFWKTQLERVYSQQSMEKILQLRQQLQSVKKGSDSISDFVLKIKNIGNALLGAGEEVNEKDLLLSLMSGVGHEYDPVVVLIANQHKTISLADAQFMLLMHEQRIEQLNIATQISVGGASAHHASSSNKGNKNIRGGYNNARGGNRSRGRGGRYSNRSGQKIHCQLCAKLGHSALQCYRRFDQQFQGPTNQGN
ncbi:hypothetical protein ACOSQ2_004391 [Xanthoceras sorbifolium]